ncbi:hypothetical protein BAPNAU_2747 [Bacillus velezensis NAU-B3]|nr:hypothetical protein BAPNAU_2747 [Bacillus velezensis NAU-B3]
MIFIIIIFIKWFHSFSPSRKPKTDSCRPLYFIPLSFPSDFCIQQKVTFILFLPQLPKMESNRSTQQTRERSRLCTNTHVLPSVFSIKI